MQSISSENRSRLTELARHSVHHGVHHLYAAPVLLSDWPQELHEYRASFVTLHQHGELRGCIGSLTATLPLVQDVSEHAFAAAFKDPRFTRVTEVELETISIHLSVLSPPQPLNFESESELLEQIRPGIDGLILKEGSHQGTFLPSVWQSLPDPSLFLSHLKQKARLEPDYWSDSITVERYTTESW